MVKLGMWSRGAAAGAVVALMMISAPVRAADDPKVASEVIALARAQWASEIAGQTAGQQMAGVADDYTEFNADYPTLLVGKSLATGMADVPGYQKPVFSDLQNPRVQVYGDTAILTYNFAGIIRGGDGKTQPATAKSTRVYVKQGGKWMLVHANFAPVAAARN